MEVNFIYKDTIIVIKSQYNNKMGDIIKKYLDRTSYFNSNSIIFLYNGAQVNENLTIEEIANSYDLNRKKMNILVYSDENYIRQSLDKNSYKIKLTIVYREKEKATEIECESEQKMGDILKIYYYMMGFSNTDSFYFLYNGNAINENLTVKQTLSSYDKNRRKMEILQFKTDFKDDIKLSNKLSRQIICPICGESAKIKLNNYKISIYECKYNHNLNDLNIDEFKSSQIIDESKIICGICKDTNKKKTYDNTFYYCGICNLGICPLCSVKHNYNNSHYSHNIIDYEDKYFICGLHKKRNNLYCKTCKKNLCITCVQDHIEHELISYEKLFIKSNDLEIKLRNFKITIDKFKEDIGRIQNILQKVIDYYESFYKITEKIFHNFDSNKINYQILNNIRELYNLDFSKKIDNIINSKNYNHKIVQILKMYNDIYNNELNIDSQSADTENLFNNSEKVKELNEKIYQKNSEIERLRSFIPLKINPGEKLMTVIFISNDQNILNALICKNTDIFKDLEDKLYEINPDYSGADNYFLSNGRAINRFKDLDYNNIKNNDIITLYPK